MTAVDPQFAASAEKEARRARLFTRINRADKWFQVLGLSFITPLLKAAAGDNPKAQMAAGMTLPTQGNVFLSVRDSDKPVSVEIARSLVSMGFAVYTTQGTHELMRSYSVDTLPLRKVSEGARPNILDKIANREIDLISTTSGRLDMAISIGNVTNCSTSCVARPRSPSTSAASTGRRTASPSGTTAPCSTTRPTTTGRSAA